MKKQVISGLCKREELASELTDKYKNNTAEKVTLLLGPSGSGKSYTLNKILDAFRNRFFEKNICTYINCGNSFISPHNCRVSKTISDLSISVGNSIMSAGIGIGIQNNVFEYNAAKKILDITKTHTVLVCIDDFSNADISIRHIFKILLENSNILGTDLSERIYFLITDSEEKNVYYFVNKVNSLESISLLPYSKQDIVQYLEMNHLHLPVSDTILNSIEKISMGNMFIVDFLFVDIAIQDNDFFEALEKVVNHRLLELKKSGHARDISESTIEDIILSSSLSLRRFTVNEISYITERACNYVANGLDLAKDNAFVDKDSECCYAFNCSEVKNILYTQSIQKRKERVLSYYKYYTENEPDEYYYRAYYLIMYFQEITSQSFALLALSLIYSFKLEDSVQISKIYTLLSSYDTSDYTMQLNDISDFYKLLLSDNISKELLLNKYKEIKKIGYEFPLQAEITRAFFHYLYCNYSSNTEIINVLLESCIQFAEEKLSLSYFKNPIGLKSMDETLVRLNVLYTILPYLLDVINDTDRFDKFFKISKTISKNNLSNKNFGIAQYIENVFNRKAFLFANQTQCEIYYEKAKSFFYKNNIWDEYCITLVCQAGTDIVIHQFDEAIELCEQAIITAEKNDIDIPQIAKLYNNQLIATFLKYEKEGKSIKSCMAKAKHTVKLLKKQLHNIPCATEYVIITNICSLSLYYEDDNSYLKYKTKLEKLMKISNIENVFNENVDDFYRYYFSWFEVFRAIRDQKWEIAKKISSSLENFIPSLFKKQELFWERKYKALIEIIEDRIPINSYDFCVNLVKINNRESVLANFFYRGLMLSDLQYTSYS